MNSTSMTDYAPHHFLWEVHDRVATIRLNRPERKNPLTFESYAELRDTFRALPYADDVDVVVAVALAGLRTSEPSVSDTTPNGAPVLWHLPIMSR